MNSKKVKEIKKGAMWGDVLNKIGYYKKRFKYTKEINVLITLINELESENERLNKSDTSKEESSIEYYNLYKDLKRKNKDLNELCELQRVSIAESFVRENQLKDRIAELEKERVLCDGTNLQETEENNILEMFCKECKSKTLKQFAEKVAKRLININGIKQILDETLKEFIKC